MKLHMVKFHPSFLHVRLVIKVEKWIVTNIIDYYLILRFKTSF